MPGVNELVAQAFTAGQALAHLAYQAMQTRKAIDLDEITRALAAFARAIDQATDRLTKGEKP